MCHQQLSNLFSNGVFQTKIVFNENVVQKYLQRTFQYPITGEFKSIAKNIGSPAANQAYRALHPVQNKKF